MYISYSIKKDTLIIFLLAFSAPLFSFRIIGSVSLFDILTIFALFMYFPKSVNKNTACLFFVFVSLFFASEVLPLLKGKSNGILHAALCLIQGSKCLLDKAEAQTKAALEVKNPV